jgi:NYN domain
MTYKKCQSNIITSALFVDFDNIFMSLLKVDPGAAKRFAENPERWLNWLEAGMSTDTTSEHIDQQRAVLIRRCYLNLSNRYTTICSAFTNAGFSIIACPLLTHHGKNSADIHMVIDILDTLQQHMHVDEFIVMSGDSDFTPVLLRLRTYDRRTTIISANGATNAYKAASDHTISGDSFMTHAVKKSSRNLLDEMAKRVHAVVSEKGAIPLSHLPALFREFEEFRDLSYTNWLGFETLRNLTVELGRRCEGLALIESQDGQAWKVAAKSPAPARAIKVVPIKPETAQTNGSSAAPSATAPTAACAQASMPSLQPPASPHKPAQNGASSSPGDTASDRQLQAKIIAAVGRIIAQSAEPVVIAWLAKEIRSIFGAQIAETHWAGVGRFKKLLQTAQRPDIVVETAADQREYVYDPGRQRLPQASLPKELPAKPLSLADYTHAQVDIILQGEQADQTMLLLVQKVQTATKAPNLTSEQYAIVFQAIADLVQAQPYDSETTVIELQKRCLTQNIPIVQAQLMLILKGLEYAGHTLGVRPEDDTPFKLALAFSDVVVRLCRAQRLDLSADEQRLIADWLGGGIALEREA